ncbi:Aldehyde/histidinol dehydrogenase [Aspergillus pseudoustus]|uniref:Aldehyde/histidinol dehydrogenase n=1 Tax=Aspergillus pseudoustus TaxID=1810923 RepID=A0ABR4IPD4_9EURO
MASSTFDLETVSLIVANQDRVTDVTFPIQSPVKERIIHLCAAASVKDATHAADAAQAAFQAWAKTPASVRRGLFTRAADLLLAKQDLLATYQHEETGCSRGSARHTVGLAANLLRDVAGKISGVNGLMPQIEGGERAAMVLKVPYGVVLGFAPWNAPFILGARAIALPLAAGNTVVLKGSELSPKCFWALGDIFREAGFPAGCVNILYHRPSEASEVCSALITHRAVRMVNFTGSTLVGAIVASIAGQAVKPVVLELGGKAPCIVLDDADLEAAAAGCAVGAFTNAGQICMSTERIIVQRAVAEEFQRLLVQAAADRFGMEAGLLRLVSSAAVRKHEELISDAVGKGARVVLDHPTILSGVDKTMDLYYTESFSPIVSLHVVDTEEDALSLANDTEYGLAAALFTRDLARGLRVAGELESGAVHINQPTIFDDPNLPHGGFKSSGFGRFGGVHGLDQFLQTKSVTWLSRQSFGSGPLRSHD